jgi:hypothetical protein
MPVKSDIVVVVIVAAALLSPTVQPVAREWLPPDYGKGSRVHGLKGLARLSRFYISRPTPFNPLLYTLHSLLRRAPLLNH